MAPNSKSFTDMLEKMPSMDALTIAVLALDAYLLYTQLDYYNQGAVFSISTKPVVLAIQATALLILLNAVEFIHDRKSSDSRY